MRKTIYISFFIVLTCVFSFTSQLYAFWGSSEKVEESKTLDVKQLESKEKKVAIENYKNEEINSLIDNFYKDYKSKDSNISDIKLNNEFDSVEVKKIEDDINVASIDIVAEKKEKKEVETIKRKKNRKKRKSKKKRLEKKEVQKVNEKINNFQSKSFEVKTKSKLAEKVKFCKSCKREFKFDDARIFCPYDGEVLRVKEK